MENVELTDQYKTALLDFMAVKPAVGADYHRFILSEISKHFGYKQMMIFPYSYRLFDRYDRNMSKYNLFNNYITLNMDHDSIIKYHEQTQYVDIFALKRLPEKLRGSKALLREDILADEEYYGSEFQKLMSSIGVDKEACIYLYDDSKGKLLATIGIFRTEDEPRFTQEERSLFEYLSTVLASQYKLILNSSSEMVTRKAFDIFFKNCTFGSILVDHRLTVVRSNSTAFELSRKFLEDFKNEKPQFYRSSLRYDSTFRDIQELIDWIGNEIVTLPSGKYYSSLRHEYHFFCSPYVITNVNGEIETCYLIQMTLDKIHVNSEAEDLFGALTTRESEILNYILKGYGNERIAELAVVSVYTVRTHISNIYRKFNVNSRVELLMAIK